MDTASALRAQLSGLKLSNGMRAGEVATPPSNPPSNVTNALRALMSEHSTLLSAQEDSNRHVGNSNSNSSNNNNNNSHNNHSHSLHHPVGSSAGVRPVSPAVVAGSKLGKLQLRSSQPAPSPPLPGKLGAVTATLTAADSGKGGEFGASGKPTRLMRAAPRSQQTADDTRGAEAFLTPSSQATKALEQLLKTLPSTANVSTLREASPPMVVLTPNVSDRAVRMATLVEGDARHPKALEPIDNSKAQRPIIRTVPPCAHRYIIVGDVHGCPMQLEMLLMKAKYEKGKDCLILAGDLVNKGPDSIGAVRVAQANGAIGVLGNHDYTLLNCIARCRGKAKLTPQEEADPVMRLASSFPSECEDYLRSLPHILRIPMYRVTVVHAGLNVDCPLERQNVYEIMHLRRLERVEDRHHPHPEPRWRAVVKSQRGEAWAALWKGPDTVIFGHDARAGLQTHPFAFGIDTGCVYGHQLTCIVYGPESPTGVLLSVDGLPKMTNEMRGLPPPAAPVYDQYAEELARLILRPTPAATPPAAPNGRRPTFLAAPPAPAAARDYATERATLLALAQARELGAINALMALAPYEAAWIALLKDGQAVASAFWIPLAQHILRGLAEAAGTEAAREYADDVLRLALEVCDEVEAVREAVRPHLQKLIAAEESGGFAMQKATSLFLHLIAAS